MTARSRVFTMLSVVLLLGASGAAGANAASAEPPPHPELLELAPARGLPAGGETVTVHGSGFVDGDTLVDVDSTLLDAHVLSSTELTYVAPAHAAGTVHIAVVVGELASVGRFYVYEQPVVPASIESPTPTGVPTPERTGSSVELDPVPAPTPDVGRHTPLRPEVPPTLAETGGRARDAANAGLALLLAGLVLVRATTPRRAWARRTR